MRYVPALLNQFRGALVGAALGDWIATRFQAASPAERSGIWHPLSQLPFDKPPFVSSVGGEAAIEVAHRLIQHRLDPAGLKFDPLKLESLIAILPIVLGYHEDREALQTVYWATDHPTQPRWEIVPIANSLAQILRQQFQPSDALADWQTILQTPYTDSAPLPPSLRAIHSLLQQQASIAIAAKVLVYPDQLNSQSKKLTAVAVALYAFLSTPAQYSLTIRRVLRLYEIGGIEQENTLYRVSSAIAGALLGAYGGINCIPPLWRRAFNDETAQVWLSSAWGIESEAAIIHLTDRLLATWSGSNDPAQFLKTVDSMAIAAIGALRY